MSNTPEARLWQIVEDAAEYVTDENGRFRKQDVEDQLYQRLVNGELAPHVQAVADRKLVQSLVRAFGEKRNPKRHRDSSSWYHPKRIIKLGYGVWVWMRYCSPTDLPEWGLQSARNNSAQNNAEVSKQRYIADRSDAFRRHSDFATLDDLERTVYGYLDAEEPHGNTSPDKT